MPVTVCPVPLALGAMTTSGPNQSWARLLPFVGLFVAVGPGRMGDGAARPHRLGRARRYLPAAARRLGPAPRRRHRARPCSSACSPCGRRSRSPPGCRGGGCSSSSYAAGLAWMLSLAYVDGRDGVGKILDTQLRVPAHRAVDDGPAARAVDLRLAHRGTTGCPTPSPTLTGRCTSPATRRARWCSSWCSTRLGLGSGFAAGHRGHPDRRVDGAGRDGDAARARGRDRGPTGGAVPGLRPGGGLAVRQRRRDVRGRGRLGHRGAGGRGGAPQHRRGRWSPGCCSATR